MNKLFIIIAMIILYLSINKNKYILILRDKKIFYKKYYIFRFNYYRNNHFYPTINKNNNINAIQIHLSFYNKDSDAPETHVVLVSSIENKGMDEVLDSYNKIVNVNKANNQFDKRREIRGCVAGGRE